MVEQQAPGEGVGTAGCLLRVFWMFVGFIILFFIGYFMATRPAATGSLSLSTLDAIYWVLVVAMVGARYLVTTAASLVLLSGKYLPRTVTDSAGGSVPAGSTTLFVADIILMVLTAYLVFVGVREVLRLLGRRGVPAMVRT